MAKIIVLFGTRPEAIKLFPVVHALRATPGVEVRVVVTAQHRAMLDQVLAVAGIAPDHDLDMMQPGQSLDALTARLIVAIGQVLDAERPDRVIVQGDTTSAMAGALAAHYRRIPVAHVEAGLRSGDMMQPWPEEANRRIISVIADLHFAPTENAAAALLRENVPESCLVVTGNTVIDALLEMRARIGREPGLAAGLDTIAKQYMGKRVIAVTAHRRESFGRGMADIAAALRRIAARSDVALIIPLHPNPQAGAVLRAALENLPNVALIEPLDYPHFVRLLDMAEIVLTDSGGVQEEAPALGKPVLVMRETTERPEGVEAGTARLVGTDPERIVHEIFTLLDDKQAYARMARAHNPYGDGQASARIARVVVDGFGSSA